MRKEEPVSEWSETRGGQGLTDPATPPDAVNPDQFQFPVQVPVPQLERSIDQLTTSPSTRPSREECKPTGRKLSSPSTQQ